MINQPAVDNTDRPGNNTSKEVLHLWPVLALFLSLYGVLLLFLLPRYALWLDEIIDLRAIRDFDFPVLIRWIPVNAGGVPLG
ncbi:MAG TPA: hypothetical protein VHZ55_30090, partial [Bryobacteraceae bacterium]|nr:hypothetical protein [Bryobacteraceae bacterium]